MCCSKCERVFHLLCIRPTLDHVPAPEDDWYCAYCIASDSNAGEEVQQLARLHIQEIEASKNNRKRPAGEINNLCDNTPSASAHPNKSRRTSATATTSRTTTEADELPNENNDASEFVKSFFQKDKPTQQKLLRALLTDDRIAGVLPAHSAVASHIPNPSSSGLSYNNELISLTDTENYQLLDPTAFHYYPPNIHGGVHRSLHDKNMDQSNFNIHNAVNKSCLHFANQINSFIMGLTLTKEQR